MPATIAVRGDHPAVRFAAAELARHLRLATGQAVPIQRSASGAGDGASAAFELGVAEDVGLRRPRKLADGDDWVRIAPRKGGYVLSGANPRSVLFAVYRYLRETGFRWLRPGKRGVVVPRLRSPLVKGLDIDEAPSYRYRTICIEGACSIEHVRDMIDWMAKHGMNGYFIQFHYGTIFFKRWYEHRGSKYCQPEPLSREDLERGVAQIEADIRDRGMSFERMGHGWTCAALGISTESGWDKEDTSVVPAEKRDWIAQVNGKRELWGGVALNTQLNFGDPEVRSAVVDSIVSYAREHPEVNLLHFWLADGTNNHDERPESQAARPSDFYVDMLNELDEKLTAAGLDTRIVFLVYVDLLWAPERAKIRNPHRFVLMFAPITRGYTTSFLEAPDTGERKQPYVRNKLVFPRSPAVNLEYLRDWQKDFRGDGFDFDYHLIWACYYDPNMVTMARTLHKDIQGLEKIGLHGLNSVQNQRMSFPHNLCMDVMARTLWDKRAKFKSLMQQSFDDAFGRDGGRVAELFSQLSKLWLPFFDPVYIPRRDDKRIAQGLRNMPRLRARNEDLRGLVRRNLDRHEGAVLWSWKYLDFHVRLSDLLLPAMEAYLRGEAEMRARLDAALDFAWKNEKALHPALDVYEFAGVLGWRANELEAHLKESAAAAVSPTTQPAGV